MGADPLTLQHSGSGGDGDSMMFDFSGHSLSMHGDSGSNWTDTLDLSHHTQTGDALYIVDSSGHSLTIDANSHGTISLTGQSGALEGSGHVFTDASHEHHAVDFHNIDKIIY